VLTSNTPRASPGGPVTSASRSSTNSFSLAWTTNLRSAPPHAAYRHACAVLGPRDRHQQFRGQPRGHLEGSSTFGEIQALVGEPSRPREEIPFIQSICAGTAKFPRQELVRRDIRLARSLPAPHMCGNAGPYRRDKSRSLCAFAGPRSGASSVKGVAAFFADFGCFGFLASRFDLLCPFAITNFLVLIATASGMVGVGAKTPPGRGWGSSMPLTCVRPYLKRGAEFDLECDHSAADPVPDVVEAISKIFEGRATRQHERQQTAFEHSCYAARREPYSRNITHRLFPSCSSMADHSITRVSSRATDGLQSLPGTSAEASGTLANPEQLSPTVLGPGYIEDREHCPEVRNLLRRGPRAPNPQKPRESPRSSKEVTTTTLYARSRAWLAGVCYAGSLLGTQG